MSVKSVRKEIEGIGFFVLSLIDGNSLDIFNDHLGRKPKTGKEKGDISTGVSLLNELSGEGFLLKF